MIFDNAAAFYMCFQCIRDKSLLRKIRSDCPYIFKSFRILKFYEAWYSMKNVEYFSVFLYPNVCLVPTCGRGRAP